MRWRAAAGALGGAFAPSTMPPDDTVSLPPEVAYGVAVDGTLYVPP
jgi:hypothetical protein